MTVETIDAAQLHNLPNVRSEKWKLCADDEAGSGVDRLLARHPDLSLGAALVQAEPEVGARAAEPGVEPAPARTGITLSEFAREYFLPHVESTLISHKEVETLMRLRILPALGHLELCEIKPQQVFMFRKQLIAEKLSASRVNAHLAALRRAFNLAIRWQLFDGRNPAAAPGMLRTEGRCRRRLKTADICRSLD